MQALKLLLTTPLMWVWYVLLVAIILLRGARKEWNMRAGWHALCIGFVFFTLFSFSPVSDALTKPLTRWYSAPSLETLARLEVITVLGGGGRHGEPSSATYSRMIEGIRLFKASNAEFFVVQGTAAIPGEPTDAEIMKKIALEKGISIEKILADPRSRTTAEHPPQLNEMLPPDIMQIGIVTSALHMPRAIAVFKNYFPDKTIVPIPVGAAIGRTHYRFADMIPSIDALVRTTSALHEWIGLVWYAVRY